MHSAYHMGEDGACQHSNYTQWLVYSDASRCVIPLWLAAASSGLYLCPVNLSLPWIGRSSI